MDKTEQFILKANKVHNNKFDYSSTKYLTAKKKVKIFCVIHGKFDMTPNNHLQGQGCPSCGGTKKLTKEQFIKISNKKHDNKFDYSLIKYDGNTKKIKIICPIHGEFEQIPKNHMNGFGCVKCRGKLKLNLNKFINLSNGVHNNKYDYSLVEYKNFTTKIKIICPIHGFFEQTPQNHIKGHACPECGGVKVPTTKEFISNAKIKHNNEFDYSLTQYSRAKTKIKIICKKHGIFEQDAGNHIQGQGCPICKSSKGEKEVRVYLEDNDIHFESQKTFNGCKNKNPLPFDFYLPNYNLCIEYDGIQHFDAIDHFGGEEKLKLTKAHDKIKNNYCKDNNIDLLRIKYNENIIEKLNSININYFLFS